MHISFLCVLGLAKEVTTLLSRGSDSDEEASSITQASVSAAGASESLLGKRAAEEPLPENEGVPMLL